MKREETSQRGRKKATQQAGGIKQSNRWHKTKAKLSNRWHKTKAKLEGYKMIKKTKNWTGVKLSTMSILIKKNQNFG